MVANKSRTEIKITYRENIDTAKNSQKEKTYFCGTLIIKIFLSSYHRLNFCIMIEITNPNKIKS